MPLSKGNISVADIQTKTREPNFNFSKIMSAFYHEEPPTPSKRCKYLAEILKDVIFCNSHAFCGRFSNSTPDEDYPTSDHFNDEEEVVSEIRSRAMEKLKRKPVVLTDRFSWVDTPITKELYITNTPNALKQREEIYKEEKDEERDEYFSVERCSGRCRSCTCAGRSSRDAFLSVKTNFSCCSSLNDGFDFMENEEEDLRRRCIIQAMCYCEGWPFGLCRKNMLLPLLPKPPAESWSWHKATKLTKMS